MEKSILEQLKEEKEYHEIASVNFFNNGKNDKDNKGFARASKSSSFESSIHNIMSILSNATSSYARYSTFDSINMDMIMGLIYDINDVEKDKIKPGSMPKDGIVRYYTGSINSYLDGEKTNDSDFGRYGMGGQGVIDYNQFVNYVELNDLTFVGPKTFEEFKEAILNGEPFDIRICANFNKEKKEVEIPEEEKQLVKKHHFFKKH